MATEDAVKATVDELLKALSARNIMGDPIEMEDKVILPITKMGMGFGTGMSSGVDNKNAGTTSGGSGAGGGVGVFPVAVVVLFKGIQGPEGVKVVPLSAPNAISESIGEIASTVINRITGHKDGGGEKKHSTAHSTSIEIE
jgi:uncharacterized spore protein YtfJ